MADNCPGRFLRIRFEDLLEFPEETIEKVCGFLGVELDKSILHTYHSSAEWDRPWRKNINKPLDKDKAFQWKKKMKDRDVKIATYLCSEMLKKFNYETPSTKMSIDLFFSALYGRFRASMFFFMEKIAYYFPQRIIYLVLKIHRRGVE